LIELFSKQIDRESAA